MKIEHISEITAASPIGSRTATRRILRRAGCVGGVSLLCAGLVACVESASAPSTTAPQTAAAPAPLPPILPFEQAVANAANTVFTAAPAGSYRVVIDPLVDGVTGYSSRATEGIQAQVTDLVQKQYPRFSIEKFSPDALKDSPLVLVGTFTPVTAQKQTVGPREAYRFCLVLADLKTGKVVAKGVAAPSSPASTARRARSSARARCGRPTRPRRPISAPARPPRSATPSTRNSSTDSGPRR